MFLCHINIDIIQRAQHEKLFPSLQDQIQPLNIAKFKCEWNTHIKCHIVENATNVVHLQARSRFGMIECEPPKPKKQKENICNDLFKYELEEIKLIYYGS